MDRTLDWKSCHDGRSRSFPARMLLANRKPRSYTWGVNTWLDQGVEGACVGYAWAHELAAKPVQVAAVNDATARAIYEQARKLDPWPGEDYSGTSVLAGAKAVHAAGHLREYRWAFGLQDVVNTVGSFGPVVLGVPWYEGMHEPDDDGCIHASGSMLGGHAILARGVNLRYEYVTLHNSWGRDWGRDGTCRISFADLDKLLREDGEACVPVKRR